MSYNAICIDGSLQNLGLAVVTLNNTPSVEGVVTLELHSTKPTTDKKMRKSYDDLYRFRSHWLALNNAITKYDCKIAIGEVPSGGQDARAAFAFGGVTALYACLPVPFIPVYPLEVKAAMGIKHADKEDIIEWAYANWPDAPWKVGKRANKLNIITAKGHYLSPTNEHCADACAIAFAGLKYIKSSPSEK